MSKGTLENNLRWRRISKKSLLTYITYIIHISFLLVHYVTEFMYCKVVIYVLSCYGLVFTVTNQSLKIDTDRMPPRIHISTWEWELILLKICDKLNSFVILMLIQQQEEYKYRLDLNIFWCTAKKPKGSRLRLSKLMKPHIN